MSSTDQADRLRRQAHRNRAIPAFLDCHYGSPNFMDQAGIEDAVTLIEDIARLYGLTVTVKLPQEEA